ncbi:MAG TPA: LapA family protein [Actinomycetota bacterium]|nr:LapA family protein [Actinomycetota bacterium]
MRRNEEGGGPAEEERPAPGRPDLDVLDRERRRRVGMLLVAVGIVLLLAIFVVRNSQRVPVDFVFFTRQARLIWIMVACAVLGGIVGYLVGRPPRRLRRRTRARDEEP